MKHLILEFLFFFHFFLTPNCTPSFKGIGMYLCWTLGDLMHVSSVTPFKKKNKPKQQQPQTQNQTKPNEQNQNNHQNPNISKPNNPRSSYLQELRDESYR